MPIIKVQKPKNNFVIMDCSGLRDRRLSFKAKGLLAYLMSLPPDWILHVSELASIEHSTDGIDAVRSGLEELQRWGYAKWERVVRLDGPPDSVWTVYDVPHDDLAKAWAKKKDEREAAKKAAQAALDALRAGQAVEPDKADPCEAIPHKENPYKGNASAYEELIPTEDLQRERIDSTKGVPGAKPEEAIAVPEGPPQERAPDPVPKTPERSPEKLWNGSLKGLVWLKGKNEIAQISRVTRGVRLVNGTLQVECDDEQWRDRLDANLKRVAREELGYQMGLKVGEPVPGIEFICRPLAGCASAGQPA